MGWRAPELAPTIEPMGTKASTTDYFTSHTQAGRGPHYLMLGNVTVSRLLDGDDTDGQLSVVELTGQPGSGPGPHIDPWRESFYVLDGELTFRVEENGSVRTVVARAGDAVSIPQGAGHAFSVTGATEARFLIASTPAGIDAFFPDAGEPLKEFAVPPDPPPFDRERLKTAFAKHGLSPFSFSPGA